MRPLDALTAAEARHLAGVVFDLDDTVLDHGALGEEAYGALFRMRAAGLRLIACTGRPAGWGEIVQRQWPVDATVVENGALAFASEPSGAGARVVLVAPRDRSAPAERGEGIDSARAAARRARRETLLGLAHEIIARFPETGLADDNDARLTDVTLDIGEHRRVPPAAIQAIRALARDRGVRTLVSSIHLHLTLEAADKATGTIRLLVDRFDEDATGARSRYAFVGDSANDAATFAAFRLTFGVANVRGHLPGLTVPPRFVAAGRMGRGFAEIAARLVMLRALGA